MLQTALSQLKNKLPNISRLFTDKIGEARSRAARFITESPREKRQFYIKVFSVSFISGFLLVAIFVKGVTLFTTIGKLQAAEQKREVLQESRQYWEKVVREHSGYRDAHFQLAIISYQLGEREEALVHLDHALTIDPNFIQGKELLVKLEE